MRIQTGGDKVAGVDLFPTINFDADHPVSFDQDGLDLAVTPDGATMLLDVCSQAVGQWPPAATPHLCQGVTGEQSRDVMAEPRAAKIDFPQAIEK